MIQINADELKQLEIRTDIRNSMLKLLDNEFKTYVFGLAQKYKIDYKAFNIDSEGNFIELKEAKENAEIIG